MVGELNLQPLVQTEDFTKETMVLPCQDSETGIRVDLIFSHSPYEQQALERIQRITMEGVEVRFASVEDVVIHKIIAGRARDLEDVEAIVLKNPRMDREYVDTWLQQFSEALGEPFTQKFKEINKDQP